MRISDWSSNVCSSDLYDYELNEVFFEDLGVRKPDHFLGTGGGTLGETLGKILIESERVLGEARPDAVLILGDTNSSSEERRVGKACVTTCRSRCSMCHS